MEIKLSINSKELTPAQKVAILGKIEEIKAIVEGNTMPKPAQKGMTLDYFLECNM